MIHIVSNLQPEPAICSNEVKNLNEKVKIMYTICTIRTVSYE